MQHYLLGIFISFFLFSCHQKTKKEHKHTNQLIHETSPYLLQHAHNPVNWHAWNQETLDKAKRENKLLLISVGYAACHWCHVMEHESFENDSVAKVMNENFINIKVDREERPDIDQTYMTAVQLITGSGGWPLNCIALPNGKPFWGGTYFPKKQWLSALTQIATAYKENPNEIITYADNLTQGINNAELVTYNSDAIKFQKQDLDSLVTNWQQDFDIKNGGSKRVPKFPMPSNYQFLLRYAVQSNNKKLQNHVSTTLDKMALGGIFDQVGGGFSRYATDENWHIPHFEKMLYDNAQLISLYADAYLITKKELYKDVVYQTFDFVTRELTSKQGAFYSSIDADVRKENGQSEEGAYYVWTQKELQNILGDDFNLFSKVYHIDEQGVWEQDKYHLIKIEDTKSLALKLNISTGDLTNKINSWRKRLLTKRTKREKPGLDDKVLTSWNGLMLKANVDAYRVFNDAKFLKAALKNAQFIKEHQLKKEGGLYHNYKNGKSTINGYLEDYASVIDGYIALYENTLDSQWLKLANELTQYTWTYFYNKELGMFYFTSYEDEQLITRKIITVDNVIPSSNSVMARNLLKLGHYFDHKLYVQTSKQMLNNVKSELKQYPSSYSNWLQLYADLSDNYYEVAVVGKNAIELIKEINQKYIPNKLIVGSFINSNAPLLKDRFVLGSTYVYICIEGACKLPVTNSKQALKLLEN
ncbi:hypothetical protein FHR24_003007 [Wenyingzhuangia heitensis]|uniref:Spermatogenesis-associated protein 20-like TRX domain-containing protein n=1 Tax=Wenyingzhuangia heitensis TaxID=1487859 RepID=A0ABX0UCG0_9FLAO|nr:thioredoxin domain-containing protein [Wenyingzhuangia heitensis]NIJ46519.1 hypothetical protein [Wenyingzhuangia heitensis]